MTDITAKTRINQLLSMAWNTTSAARTQAIADQILELDRDNPEALMIKADSTENAELRKNILFRALKSLNKPENFDHEDKDMLFLVINQRLAYTFFEMNKLPEAFSFCDTALKFAAEHEELDVSNENDPLKILYYRILIELKQWQRILTDTMRDEEQGLAWAYARLTAAYMLNPGQNHSICANMFWDALMAAPDVPFYMLGYFEEPDENADPEVLADFDFALMFYDVLSVSDEFFNWFSRGVILFGLLSNRFDSRERDYMIDAIDSLGGFDEYEKMSSLIVEGDDAAIIEMLAANKCLAD